MERSARFPHKVTANPRKLFAEYPGQSGMDLLRIVDAWCVAQYGRANSLGSHTGESKSRTWTREVGCHYRFAHENDAFAFKMRWA